jgi:hypothetical protein
MRPRIFRLKIAFVLSASVFALIAVLAGRDLAPAAGAMGAGPPNGFTGAPDENDCRACHLDNDGPGAFTLGVPAVYFPGRTYSVTVTHSTTDTTRRRWGFQMTSLVGTGGAGTFASINNQTQTGAENGRSYINHTNQGSFANQAGGATWTFNWTAPVSGSGPVTFYAAGNQANNDHNSDNDQIYFAVRSSRRQTGFIDFDGDLKTDTSISRVNGPDREWWWTKSSDLTVPATIFGVPSDTVSAADFTGDGKTDVAFFRASAGQWFVLRSEDFSYFAFAFGADGDVPAPADYDGDGKADAAVYRPASGTWFISRSSDSQVVIRSFGSPADKPVVADFDGDGKADISIWKPDLGQWWRINSATDTVIAYQFGAVGDRPVPGDYTGDGKADVAIFRPSIGTWFVLRSEDSSFYAFPFGIASDIPVTGDYDGDGRFDAGVFRPSNATWYVNQSTAGTLIRSFGASADQPLPGAFIP